MYVDVDRDKAGTLCHMESSFMMEIAQEAAMEKRQNIWIDGSLRNAQFYSGVFKDIRSRFPHYRISIFYVYAPEETIRQRVRMRAEKTGRDVPEKLWKQSLEAMDKSLNTLTPLCDFVARIKNDSTVPVLAAFETVSLSGCWSIIKDRFGKLEKVGEFPLSLAPLPLAGLPPDHRKVLTGIPPNPNKPDSPKNHMLLLDCKRSRVKSKAVEIHSALSKVLERNLELLTSPTFQVTLSDFARKMAGIPTDAHTFFWVYSFYDGKETHPLSAKNLLAKGLSQSDIDSDTLVQLLRFGGFCYCDKEQNVVAANAISGDKDKALLQFGPPGEVAQASYDAIESWRCQEVTVPYLHTRGARKYCWLLPGEIFAGVNVGGDHGAFVYKMDEKSNQYAIRFPVMMD